MNLTVEQIKKILRNWSIENITKIKKSEKGNVNHNWIIITKNKKYILRRLHDEYSKKDVKFEIKYLNYLKEVNFPYEIPSLIKTLENEQFIKTKEGFFLMYGYIKGAHNNKKNIKVLAEIAKMSAIYHNMLEKSKLDNEKKPIFSYNKYQMKIEFEKYIKNMPNNERGKKEIFIQESKKLIPLLKSLNGKIYNSLKKYPIHRDLNPENVLWRKNRIIAIIDFDNVSHTKDAFIRDIAIIFQYYCSDKKRNFFPNKARQFIEEYKKYRSLSKKEISIIPDLLISTYLEDFGYAYWMLVHDPKRAKLNRLKKYSNAAQKIFKNRENIIAEITS